MENEATTPSLPAKTLDTASEETSPVAESGTKLLTEDAFSSERSQRLFEAIDELQSCGANRDIELPELVIVGDQSAGKSSLLQSLTDIPFPVAGKLCTRFPTRIVSRRTTGGSDLTRVSIEATDSGPFSQAPLEERRQHYAKFDHSSSTFTASEFLTVVDKATKLMGITDSSSSESASPAADKEKHFSSDILRIELSGPNRSYFSILDLPGVFQSLTKNLTAKEKNGVRDLVSAHMRSEQSVIICVANGTNDLANQAIFDMSSTYDPKGLRTVGVITKCDITQHVNQILELAQNREKSLQHGWFVVRNRTPVEVEANIAGHDREKREDNFFEGLPWNTLSRSRRGVQALKKYLADLLCTQIQRSFPVMFATLQSRRANVALELQCLGQPRDKIEQKRIYLSGIADQFHSKAKAALEGKYGTMKSDDMKLRKIIRDRNDTFMQKMRTDGHLVPFAELPTIPKTIAGTSDIGDDMLEQGDQLEIDPPVFGTEDFGNFGHPERALDSDLDAEKQPFQPAAQTQTRGSVFGTSLSPDGRRSISSKRSSRASTPTKSRTTTRQGSNLNTPERAVEANPSSSNLGGSENSHDIYELIRREIAANRGTELQGTLNPEVLEILFHKQASKWRAIAIDHFNSIMQATGIVMGKIRDEIVHEKITRNKIWKVICDASEAQQADKERRLNERMEDLTKKHLQTSDPAFLENVDKARLVRFQAALYRYQRESTTTKKTQANKNQLVIDLRNASALFDELHISNSRNLEHEIHDTLKAYYDIARDDFIEFVTQLIVEKYLDNKDGPVLRFSPNYMANLSDKDIEELAKENEAAVLERVELEETLARLRGAEEIALRYA